MRLAATVSRAVGPCLRRTAACQSSQIWVNYAASQSSTRMSKQKLYRLVFMSQGQVYEIYARSVSHGDLFGFVEVEELVFGERTTVVVDPAEEKIKSEFAGVQRTYIPMHAVMRIDQVEKQGVSKVIDAEGSNVTQFPMPVYTPPGEGGGTGGSGDN